jgi:hypothetical protein
MKQMRIARHALILGKAMAPDHWVSTARCDDGSTGLAQRVEHRQGLRGWTHGFRRSQELLELFKAGSVE